MNADSMLPQFDRMKIKTPIGFFSTLFRLMKIRDEGILPAIVKSYDRASGIATVLPLVKNLADGIDGKEIEVDRAECSVPVVRFIHGGYMIDAPLFVGDTGWLVAGDRNSYTARSKNSAILKEDQGEDGENKGPQKPDDCSLGSFAWGFFIPDSWGTVEIPEGSGMIVKGKTISIDFESIKIVGAESVDVQIKDGASASIRKELATIKVGERSLTLSGDGPKYSGPTERRETLVTKVRYDMLSHQIQTKQISAEVAGNIFVNPGEESDWKMVEGGQAEEAQ